MYKGTFFLLLAVGVICATNPPAGAQPAGQFAVNPPNARVERGPTPTPSIGLTGQRPLVTNRPAGEAFWAPTIDYTDAQIFNPRTRSYDKVRLRSYRDADTNPDNPFVAPTINLVPGETFRVALNNALPADDPSCADHPGDPNIPHCFNSTNLHTHGLWVSPAGNSDNVLLTIRPGVTFEYEVNIPADHPAGTFWYHPHLHGSTALQVSSGMAGALIIHGDRLPQPDRTGDIDTLLRNDDGSAFTDRVVLLQQIQYACHDADGRIKTDPANDPAGQWVCDPGDVGVIEEYDSKKPNWPDQFGPGTWTQSGRYTTIGGRTIPTFPDAVAGRIERWRFIHAGVRDTVRVSFRKATGADASALTYDAATAEERGAFVDAACGGADLEQLSLALDGLTRPRIFARAPSTLQPGYREDLLMVFPEAGLYCLIDNDSDPSSNVNGEPGVRQVLGFVQVAAGPGMDGLSARNYVQRELVDAAARFMPGDVRDTVIADLEDNLGLASFVPHPTIADDELDDARTGGQKLGFNLQTSPPPVKFQVGSLDANHALLDPKSYDPNRVDRELELGTAETWILRAFFNAGTQVSVGHPFHIHVNPFEIIAIRDPSGTDVSGDAPGNASIYAGLKHSWKDTLFIEGGGYEFEVRTRYQRYIGEYVLHCHILDHEDQGMMQNVRISLPDGKGGVAQPGHR